MLGPVKDDVQQAKIAHRRTPTADDFPMPTKQKLKMNGLPKPDQALASPAKSSFTFSSEDLPHAMSTPPSADTSPIAREQSRSTPGKFSRTISRQSSVEGSLRQEGVRSRSQQMLPFREPQFSAREKVHRDSVILAEVKTNIIVRDEFLFLNELSNHLSQRYHKPTSSIFVTLDHSACLLFASSFDSAYTLTITALPSQILASANKRNAALMQSFMTSTLGVLPDRGVIKFVGIPEEYLATAGTTVQGQAERLERLNNEERKPPDMPLPQLPPEPRLPPNSQPPFNPQAQPHTQSQPQSQSRRTTTQRRKPPALSLVPKSQSMPGSRMPSPAPNDSPAIPAIPIHAQGPSSLDRKAEKMQKAGKRKSIMAFFGR